MPDSSLSPQQRAKAYWRANRMLIAILLVIWAVVSYGCSILFIDQLNAVSIGSVPLGFWFAQQGSIYVFIVLILVYAVGMDRLDRKYNMGAAAPGGPQTPGTTNTTDTTDNTDTPVGDTRKDRADKSGTGEVSHD